MSVTYNLGGRFGNNLYQYFACKIIGKILGNIKLNLSTKNMKKAIYDKITAEPLISFNKLALER